MTGTEKLLRLNDDSHKRLVEWEPYKAACGNNGFQKQSTPVLQSNLVAYEICADIPPRCRPEFLQFPKLIESKSQGNSFYCQTSTTPNRTTTVETENEQQSQLVKEVEALRSNLEIERKVNSELKKLLVNALSEDLHCKLSALAEDKIRLANNIDTYYNREQNNMERQEQLHIENALWKSKFLAIAIRADDISYNLHVALKLFKKAQLVIHNLSKSVADKSSDLSKTIYELLNIDVLSLYNKSPCNDRAYKQSFTSTLTVTCCGRCADKEIKLV